MIYNKKKMSTKTLREQLAKLGINKKILDIIIHDIKKTKKEEKEREEREQKENAERELQEKEQKENEQKEKEREHKTIEKGKWVINFDLTLRLKRNKNNIEIGGITEMKRVT